MQIREICAEEFTPELLRGFCHHQRWTEQWVKGTEGWKLQAVQKERTWDEEKRKWIPEYLAHQLRKGGCVLGAFDREVLVGFCAVDGEFFGGFANLTMLFVDDRYQRKGLGKALFYAIAREAKRRGGERLYISAIPSRETIAFYLAVGCQDTEILPQFVDSEEDRPLEFYIEEKTGGVSQ